MSNMNGTLNNQDSGSNIWAGLLIAVLIGGAGYGISILSKTPAADPLLIALILGIIIRAVMVNNQRFKPGFTIAPAILLPIGIIFYGARNLNFAKFTTVDSKMIILLIVIMIVYFSVTLLLGKLLGQQKRITYLIASGSAICGASAIAVASPAVEAEPDDVSISLLSVAIAAFFGFSIILPFLAALFDLSCTNYCLMSGSVLQFTGLVKVASSFTPFLKEEIPAAEMMSIALSMKAFRYLGLLIAVPLFASLIKKKLHVPWFLWAFLAAGLFGTWMYVSNPSFYSSSFNSYLKVIHVASWSVAMAAIGLNADVKGLFSNNGSKAIVMAFAGFIAATATFFIGLNVIQSF